MRMLTSVMDQRLGDSGGVEQGDSWGARQGSGPRPEGDLASCTYLISVGN